VVNQTKDGKAVQGCLIWDAVYAFFINFLSAFYEFSNVMVGWVPGEGSKKCNLSSSSD
jgi:hypothetical protein